MFLYEIIGTALVVFATNISGSNPVGFTLGPLAAILIILATVQLTGHVSGAHFNPALTLGVLIMEGLTAENIVFAAQMMVSQIFGGFVGTFMVYSILITDGLTISPRIFLLCPG